MGLSQGAGGASWWSIERHQPRTYFRCVPAYRALLFSLLLLFVPATAAQDSLALAQADTLFEHQEWKAARKIYDRIIDAGDAPATAYHRRAVCNDRLGVDRELVLPDLAEALRRDPKLFKALLFRARMYKNNLMFPRAIDDLTVALTCAPDTEGVVDCLADRGSAYNSIRSFDLAIADYRQALELDTAAYYVMGRLANTLDEIGQLEEALSLQKRYVAHEPDEYTGYMNVGFYLGKAGRYEEALVWYEKAIEHGGVEYALVWNNRGYAKYKLGDLNGALKDIRKSLDLRSWNSYAYRNLALVYIAQGKKGDACTALEDALKWGFTEEHGDEVKLLYADHCK